MIRGIVRIELNTRAEATYRTKVERFIDEHEGHVKTGAAAANLIVIIAGSNVADQPRGVIRSVVSPQFSVVDEIIGIEVDGVANEDGR